MERDCDNCLHYSACLHNSEYYLTVCDEYEDKSDYRKQSEGEWISVEERLPEDVYGKDRKKITVLVCTKSGKVSTASRQRKVKFNSTKLYWEELDTFEWSKEKRVTHWMPLPTAPKKGGDE